METEAVRKQLKAAVKPIRQEATIHTDSTLHERITKGFGAIPNPRSVPEAERLRLESEVTELVFRTNAQKLQADLSRKVELKIKEFPSKEVLKRLQSASFDAWNFEIQLILGTIRELYDQEVAKYGAETTDKVDWEYLRTQSSSSLFQNIKDVECVKLAEFVIQQVSINIDSQPLSANISDTDREMKVRMDQVAEETIQWVQGAAGATGLPEFVILRIRADVKAAFALKQLMPGEGNIQAIIARVMAEQIEAFRPEETRYSTWDWPLKQCVYTAWVQQTPLCGRNVIRNFEILLGTSQADVLSAEEMNCYSDNYKSSLTLEWKCYLAVAMLMAAVGAAGRDLAGSTFQVEYNAAIREAFTQVMKQFLWSLNTAYFVNSAELSIVPLLSSEAPLLSHIPADEILQVASLGSYEYQAQLNRGRANTLLLQTTNYFISFFNSDPAVTHQPVTFNFQPLAPVTTCATTLAISGWISKGESPAELWAGLKGGACTGNILNFSWEAGSVWNNLMQSVGAGTSSCIGLVASNIAIKSVTTMGKLFVPAVVGSPVGVGIGVATALFTVATWPIDFKNACSRAKFAGIQLARIIHQQGFGQNPVNLIAYSLGCRVTYHCLKELSRLSNGQPFIHNVLLMGGAAKNDSEKWRKALGCVCGRAINVYCEQDWVLIGMYKPLMLREPAPIGLGPIRLEKVENVDATSYVTGHLNYRDKLPEILLKIGIQP